MKEFFINLFNAIKEKLGKLSFKTGVIVLSLCVPFYILSFVQMGFDISYSLKGVLWVVFFGLAKTFQYAGILILGVDGCKRIKASWRRIRNAKVSDTL